MEDRLIGSSRDRQKRDRETEERERGREREGEGDEEGARVPFGERSFSRPSCARTYKAPSLARIFDSEVARKRGSARDERTGKRRKTLFSVVR